MMVIFVIAGLLVCLGGLIGMLVTRANERITNLYIISMIGLLISLIGWVGLAIHAAQTGGTQMSGAYEEHLASLEGARAALQGKATS